jgi:endonuclease YncB( thermonuclease family)
MLLLASPLKAEPTISGRAVVTDGDTLAIGPVVIRLHGIDAPEAGQQCQRANGRSWQCGTEATSRLAELVEGQEIECVALDRDAYRRVIGRCIAYGVDVNAAMAAEGLAWAFTRYSNDYVLQEADARASARGIWQGTAQPAWEYRAAWWERAALASPRPGWPIKGNINRSGEKIYHTPWSPWYDRTQIDETRGQRWFCDEEEAQAAGWRAARWR